MRRRNFFAVFSAAAVGRIHADQGAPAAVAGVYDVSTFGAKGDGTTDDRGSVQRAIDAAQHAGGGVVYFPPGTYSCSCAGAFDTGGMGLGKQAYGLTLGAVGHVTLRGAGRGLSVLKKSTAGGRAEDYNLLLSAVTASCPRITLEDLTLDGGQTARSVPFNSGGAHLLLAIHMGELIVQRCTFENARGGGLYVWQSPGARVEQCCFRRLDIDDDNNAITLIGSNAGAEPWHGGHVVRDCRFVDNGQIGIGIGGYTGSGPLKDVLISGCQFSADTTVAPAASAIELVSDPAGPLERVTVENCTVVGGTGFAVQGTHVCIRGCQFKNMNGANASVHGQAIIFSNPKHAIDVTLESIVVDTTAAEGILVGGRAGGAGHLRLINVAVFNAAKEGIKEIPAAWGVAQALEGTQFIGCRAVDCGFDGFSIDSPSVQFIDCVATGNGRAAPDTYSGLLIQNGREGTTIIGGRYGAPNENQQRHGINNRGTRTRAVGAALVGHVSAVNPEWAQTGRVAGDVGP